MDANRLTRRQFLKGTGGMIFVGYVALSGDFSLPAPSKGDHQEVIAGIVERVESLRTLKIRDFGEEPVLLMLSDDATFSRGRSGYVTGPDAFVPGDEVVAEGRWAGDDFAATTLMSLYRLDEGRIVQRQGDRLWTTSGAVQLASDTTLLDGEGFVNKSLAELGVGDNIVVEVWLDPSTRDRVALRIGARRADA